MIDSKVLRERSNEVLEFFDRIEHMEKELFTMRPEFLKLYEFKDRMKFLFENNVHK